MTPAPWTQQPGRQLPAGRHGLSRDFVAQSQRERILDALVACVAEQGYPETRVTDLIARSGVSRKTFYEHFADKEECFLAAYDMAVSLLMGGVTQAFEQEDDWVDAIRAALRAFLGFLADHPDLTRLCIVDVHAVGPRALARRDAAVRGFYYLLDAGRADAPRALPGLTAEAVTGGMYEIVYGRVLRGTIDELPRLLPELMYWAMMPFLGHEAAVAEMERLRAEAAERPSAAAPKTPPTRAIPPRRSGRRPRSGATPSGDDERPVPPRRSGRRPAAR
ncbi:TetR/AcrR family transcriptional regulator [Conexibacter arvalis]|uniref:AcrR family transcriptional regulator n=1 Tax=Conexibacter arvalis TaxID=912552 RepID=A0A840IBQ0_9ACTN|nr:TetR/AcrR family transcriptional regulator [Conexibacter arvalis]MBB4661360.1 AcrR family transcriptional regulator [Conexibacter arvalis]